MNIIEKILDKINLDKMPDTISWRSTEHLIDLTELIDETVLCDNFSEEEQNNYKQCKNSVVLLISKELNLL